MSKTTVLLPFLLCFLSLQMCIGQEESILQPPAVQVEIPPEVLSRLPEDQLSQFIRSRERALEKHPEKRLYTDAYEEIGISRVAVSRIPEGQLFRFFLDRGYVILEPQEDIAFDVQNMGHDFNNGPSPKQVLFILYLLIGIAALIIILMIVLGFLKKRGDQQIIILALEQGVDIPYDLIRGNKSRSYMRIAIVLIVTGLGIFFAGTFDVLPSALGIIPLTIGLGFIIAAFLIRD